MIRKFINKLLGRGEGPADSGKSSAKSKAQRIPLGKRVEIPAAEHGIDPNLLDERAVRVVSTLQEAGFEAYVVGGAVRDLLVGRRPKDFDVATNATPEQVKGLFRRAFIIGRRFRIVHVVYGRGRDHEVIEVSTFRAYVDTTAPDATPQAGKEASTAGGKESAKEGHGPVVVDASGRVLRDNVWGPQIEDAARRDFTINAMYYDPRHQTVIDYHGGLADVRAKVLRMIGDPVTRYREDPVRILRVIRFAAKLGFAIDEKSRKPLKMMASLLSNVPVSRLFDEMIKLLQTGHALQSLEQLRLHGLDKGLFPVLDAAWGDESADSSRHRFVELALRDTDARVAEGKSVAPSFMLACMLWHDVLTRWTRAKDEGLAPMPALSQAIDEVFDARIGDISGRGKLAVDMRDIWQMQPRFERRTGNAPYALVEQQRFRAGFDFLRLRADTDEVAQDLVDWWEDFSLGDDQEREALVEAVRAAQRPASGHKPKRGPKPPRNPQPLEANSADQSGASSDDDRTGDAGELGDSGEPGEAGSFSLAAPKKRRRRRRKPSGAQAGAESGTAAGESSGGAGDA